MAEILENPPELTAENGHITDEIQRQSILYDSLTSKRLELTLSPTDKCNFRCAYCYEDFKIGKMRPEVISGIKNLISKRSAGLDFLQISWFGGEPLVAFEIVKEIGQFAAQVAEQSKFALFSSMTTNGYLLDAERIVCMSEIGIRTFQISLDGDELEHNKTRIKIDRSGTFDKIWANLLLFDSLRKAKRIGNVNVIIRIHVHQENIDSIYDLSRRIKDQLSPEIFSVHLKNIARLGGKNDDSFPILDEETDHHKIIHAKIVQTIKDFKPEIGIMSNVCYASKGNAFFVRPDGRISKCTVALNDDFNTVGSIQEDGSLRFDQNKLTPWLHGLSTMNIADLACPLMRLPSNTSNNTAA